MVELCMAERLGWTGMTIATAILAATPRLHSMYEHGKIRAHAPPPSEAGSVSSWLQVGVPKRMFSHFYLLCLASSALIFADLLLYRGTLFTERIQGNSVCSRVARRSGNVLELGAESLLCLLLLALQAARRLWECLVVTNWGSSRMSLVGYVAGIVHYQLMILTVLVEGPPLGYVMEVAWLRWGNFLDIGLALAGSVRLGHAVAVGLFIVGFIRQHEAIRHLASLRGSSPKDRGNQMTSSNAYAIPTEGWFQYVSCAHYFAELLVYGAFVLLGSFKGRGLGQGYLVAFAWVFANHALVAGRSHAWYKQKFEDYPRERMRLIPGVW